MKNLERMLDRLEESHDDRLLPFVIFDLMGDGMVRVGADGEPMTKAEYEVWAEENRERLDYTAQQRGFIGIDFGLDDHDE